MGFNIRKIAAASSIAVAALAGSGAQAAIVVNDWTLNLTGIDGLGATVVSGIDQIQFTGVAHTENFGNVSGASPLPAVGDLGRTQGVLTATSFLHNGGIIVANGGLSSNYEITFKFDVGNVVTSAAGTISTFTHLAGASNGATGLLEIYVDNLADGVASNQGTGAGYTDGVLVATFLVQAGLGGVFTAGTLNGSDDASFLWVSGLANVIQDGSGNDLANSALLGVTASQFDADQDNDGSPDVSCPANGVIGTAAGGPGFNPKSFCAQEDGRASLQQLPEPGSLALVGLALGAVGFAGRRLKR